MQGAASGIDGCDAGRCQYHVLLPCVATDVFQQGGFTRTGFACEENRVTGKLYEFQRALELRVLKVYFNVFFQIFGAMMSRAVCEACGWLPLPSLAVVSVFASGCFSGEALPRCKESPGRAIPNESADIVSESGSCGA